MFFSRSSRVSKINFSVLYAVTCAASSRNPLAASMLFVILIAFEDYQKMRRGDTGW
jgi:hypothetical protein